MPPSPGEGSQGERGGLPGPRAGGEALVSRRGRVARWFERALLGSVMSVIAFVIERRVLKALKSKESLEEPRTGELAPSPHSPTLST